MLSLSLLLLTVCWACRPVNCHLDGNDWNALQTAQAYIYQTRLIAFELRETPDNANIRNFLGHLDTIPLPRVYYNDSSVDFVPEEYIFRVPNYGTARNLPISFVIVSSINSFTNGLDFFNFKYKKIDYCILLTTDSTDFHRFSEEKKRFMHYQYFNILMIYWKNSQIQFLTTNEPKSLMLHNGICLTISYVKSLRAPKGWKFASDFVCEILRNRFQPNMKSKGITVPSPYCISHEGISGYERYEHVIGYPVISEEDSLRLVLLSKGVNPTWMAPFRAFTLQLWLLILVVSLVISFILKWLMETSTNWLFLLFHLLAIQMSFSVGNQLTNSTRLLFALLFLSSVIFVALFQSQMFTLYNNPGLAPMPQDFNDLDRLNYTVYIHGYLKDFFSNYPNLIKNTNFQQNSKDIVLDDRKTWALSEIEFNYLIATDNSLQNKYYLLPKKIITSGVYCFVNRDNPMAKQYIRVLNRISWSGLRIYWKSIALHLLRLENRILNDITDEKHIFTLEDLKGAFLVLIGGYILAIATFLIEVVISQFKILDGYKILDLGKKKKVSKIK